MSEKIQNREIKFLVWDSDKKRMSEPISIFRPIILWTDGDIDMPTQFAISKNSRFFFRQYTGLKDKNGKEIYEGDIDSHGRYIEYRDGAFHVVQNNGQTFDYLSHMKHIEIIGNIYSDPELLES